jgi:hypothetical protein
MALLDGLTTPTPQAPGYVQDALNKPFAFSNTQAALNPGQLQQQAADTAYQSATRYLDPQFQRQQSGLENQLANQGITRGSEAWNNATDQFNANKNQAYDQARSQAYTQGLGGANQALNTMFQQSSLDTAKQNAQLMADAMKKQGMYGLGAGLLSSPSGMKTAGSILGGLGNFGSSALSGLGGLFGSGNDTGLLELNPETASALGLETDAGSMFGDLGGLFGNGGSSGFDPTGGYLTAAMAADKLMGGKLGVGKTVNNLVGGATNAVSDFGNGIANTVSDIFDW